MSVKPCAVVALGGNALWHPDEKTTIADQFRHTRASMEGIVHLVKAGYNLVITHGNGPQVGVALRRVELTRGELPDVPLGVLVADTQGSMGYMIEQSLQNILAREKLSRSVVTIVTQVLVDERDPALGRPAKFIGQSYPEKEALKLMEQEGWTMKPYKERWWRRVVASPRPLRIINGAAIQQLVNSGVIVVAAGGGGIPVYFNSELGLEGVDAVIDKDLASAVLASEIQADELCILTNVDAVRLDYGTLMETSVSHMTTTEARKYLKAGQFPAGNMGPKVEAVVQFIENGGKRAIICELANLDMAWMGSGGTVILPG